jgi:hypothetical protein
MGKSEQGALGELMVEEDEDFIDAAYALLLNRAPDAIGAAAYLGSLRSGKSKIQILYEMAISDEARLAGRIVAGLDEAFVREGLIDGQGLEEMAYEIHNAEQLLGVADVDRFIALGYRLLLRRRADPEGASNYRALLGQGLPRTSFLHALFSSPERAALGTQLPGLRDAFLQAGLPIEDDQAPAVALPAVRPPSQELGLHTALESRVESLERSLIILRQLIEAQNAGTDDFQDGVSSASIRLAVDARAEEIFRNLRRGGCES